ncbi:MAG: phosphatidate cytidylyltransferase [Polyangiales bacterium]|jgi:phosphatidate cytidylyltransferase
MTEIEAPQEKKKLSGTALRFASAIPLVAVAIMLMFVTPLWLFQLFGLLWIGVVASELMKMTMPGPAALPRYFGVVATVGLAVVVFRASHVDGAILAAIFGIVIGALVVSLISPTPIEDAGRRVAWMIGGPIYVGATLGTLGVLESLPHGGAWVLLVTFCAFLSDTGAYFAGRFFGKTKLYPIISPKKTVEGAIGGLIVAALGALAVQQTLLTFVPPWHAALLGVVAAALGQSGDLFESLIKRSSGVKDSGTIMPGHGGLFDRSDALMFASATVWLYVTFVLPSIS